MDCPPSSYLFTLEMLWLLSVSFNGQHKEGETRRERDREQEPGEEEVRTTQL